jgi:hypothetical protein
MFWSRARLLVAGFALCVAAGAGLQQNQTAAFSVSPVRDPIRAPARFNNTTASLVDGGVRGLGGGLEYAVAADLCDRVLPMFREEVPPTCEELTDAVRGAMEHWTAGSATLRFTDVTARIVPQLPTSPTNAAVGAEIDIIAVSPAEEPRVAPFAMLTSTFVTDPSCRCVAGPLVTTAGTPVPGPALAAADIKINDASCLVMGPQLASAACRHFPSLLLKMVGVAIGLTSADSVRHNIDSDTDPNNAITIDCLDPTKGLQLTTTPDSRSAMNHDSTDPGQVPAVLTADDLAGRDFLYPTCP